MEFSTTTFVLEIINFLVLLWILQRWFYRPVRDAIARRRDAAEKVLADARATEARAEALQHEYQGRLDALAAEANTQRLSLAEEIAAERGRLLESLQADLARERDRQHGVDEKRARDQKKRDQLEANRYAAAFAARLLSRLASPRLDAEIVDLVVEDIRTLPPRTRQNLSESLVKEDMHARINSAHVLGSEQRKALTTLLETLANRPVTVTWLEDADLVGGISVEIGAWVLRANLRDELRFFSEADQHAF